MVARAAAKGRTTSAKTVQASQVFSQAHLRAYFIGIVKPAFVTPAIMRVAMPHELLLTMGFLPLSLGHINGRPKNSAANIEYMLLIRIFYHFIQHDLILQIIKCDF